MSGAAAIRPASIGEAAERIAAGGRLLPVGAGSKARLASPPPGFRPISLAALSGIIEYEPGEYTFTALAGTRLSEIKAALAAHGQHLPFDPPLAGAGATLGGTIAAGLSGPGRLRYGGVRDFIIGARFITGRGEVVRGGGKVVKNAAGFDFPKLFVGSLGRLGAIVEASFKVFPEPPAHRTLRIDASDFAAACGVVARLAAAPFDLEGLEMEPPGRVWLRLGGAAETLPGRLDKLETFIAAKGERLEGAEEGRFWAADPWEGGGGLPLAPAGEKATGASAPGAAAVVKVPLTLGALPGFEREMGLAGAGRRYSAGGSLAWVTWPGPIEDLDRLLRDQGLSGLVLFGEAPRPLIGALKSDAFRQRIKAALDPDSRFPDL